MFRVLDVLSSCGLVFVWTKKSTSRFSTPYKRNTIFTPRGERDMTTTTTNANNPFANVVVDFHHENFDAKPKQRHIFEDDSSFGLPRVMGFQGTFRNRTTRFESLREEYAARSRGEATSSARGGDALEVLGTSRLLEAAIDSTTASGGGGGGGDDVGRCDVHGIAPLPPAWVDVCEHIQRDMEKAKAKIEELQRAQQKAVLPTFDVDDVNDEKIVEQLTGECGRLFKRCEAQLKRLGSDAEVKSANANNDFDDIGTKMRKNATRKLAMELSRLSQAFRQRQKDYLNELKYRQDRGPGAEGVDALEDVFRNRVMRSNSGFLEQDDGGGGNGSQMQRQGFANQDVMSLEAEERDTEVKKILQSVTDLAMVMQDMSKLIIDQGTILDSIEYNCATTAMQVDEGRKELVKAEHTQRAGGIIICIYFLMFMCVLMTIIIILQKL